MLGDQLGRNAPNHFRVEVEPSSLGGLVDIGVAVLEGSDVADAGEERPRNLKQLGSAAAVAVLRGLLDGVGIPYGSGYTRQWLGTGVSVLLPNHLQLCGARQPNE